MATEAKVEEIKEEKNMYVRVAGVTYELNCEGVGLNTMASDEEIKQRLFEYFDGVHDFSHHIITREPSGAILVKPSPVYG